MEMHFKNRVIQSKPSEQQQPPKKLKVDSRKRKQISEENLEFLKKLTYNNII